MLTLIGEHSVNLDLLPEKANVLDAGCRGFDFFMGLTMLGHKVFPVDIDQLDTRIVYHRIALSHRSGTCTVQRFGDPQATRIGEGNSCSGEEVEMLTIEDFTKRAGVDKWDLIKLDIEGEEYKILKSAQHPMATQVSVEFHEHTDKKVGKEKLDALLDSLGQFYNINNRVWESRHGAGFNYWDILLTVK